MTIDQLKNLDDETAKITKDLEGKKSIPNPRKLPHR